MKYRKETNIENKIFKKIAQRAFAKYKTYLKIKKIVEYVATNSPVVGAQNI